MLYDQEQDFENLEFASYGPGPILPTLLSLTPILSILTFPLIFTVTLRHSRRENRRVNMCFVSIGAFCSRDIPTSTRGENFYYNTQNACFFIPSAISPDTRIIYHIFRIITPLRNSVFATISNFLILIFLQPYVIDLRYFKLLLDQIV